MHKEIIVPPELPLDTQSKISIPRRLFIAGSVAALLAGCSDGKSAKNTTPIKPNESVEAMPQEHRIGLLLNKLKREGDIQNVSVHHPAGADDTAPRNPVIYIKDYHAGQNGSGITEEGVRFTFHKYNTLLTLHQAGMQRFRCEGYLANEDVPAFEILRSDDTIAPPAQVLWTYKQPKYFAQWATAKELQGRVLPVEQLFVASVGSGATVKGSENPQTIQEHIASSRKLQQLRKELDVFFVSVREAMDARGDFSYEFPFDGDADKIRIGRQVFAASALRDNLVLYKQYHYSMMDGEEAQQREQYIATNLNDAEVIVFGAHHAVRMKDTLPKQNRSVYIIEPTGLPPHGRPWDVHAYETVLQILEKK